MASVNKVILVGNLGKDPEIRYTSSGNPVANFTLATSESWKDKQGSKQERTEWHRIVVWGKTAELCGQYLKQGRQVFIEGKLATNSWEDKNGSKRYQTQVVADSVKFIDSSRDGGGNRTQPPPSQQNHGYSYGEQSSEDEIPF